MPIPKRLTKFNPLTDKQFDILIGSLLGDGYLIRCVERESRNFKFGKRQSLSDARGADKKDYLLWHTEELVPYNVGEVHDAVSYRKIINNRERIPANVLTQQVQSRSYYINTCYHQEFTELAKKWYLRDTSGVYVKRNNRKIKIVPHDIKLTPLSLCVWYMDDGFAYAKDANLILCTHGFTWEECEFLVERLRDDLGIHSKVRAKDGDQIIYVGRKSYFDFIEMVKPHVKWNCFQYKLDTTTYNKLPHQGETHEAAKLTEQNIIEIFKLADEMPQKEIAKQYGLTTGLVSMILSGDRWSHLGMPKRMVKRRPRISEDKKQLIKMMSAQGSPQSVIARELNINQASVSRILSKKEIT
jgi:DNA-binding MarR family transcriptional regulator